MVFFGFVLGFVLGAIGHERDIARNLAENGDAGYAAWVTDISCK